MSCTRLQALRLLGPLQQLFARQRAGAAAVAAAGGGAPAAAAGLPTLISSNGTAAAAAARGVATSRHQLDAAPAAAGAALPDSLASATDGPAGLYVAGLASGGYRPDPLQQVTVQKLQSLYDDLRAAYPPPQRRSGLTLVDTVGITENKQSWFDGLTTLLKSQAGLHGTAGPGGQRPSIKGLYMFGGVGCGKTMLMDLLVASAPPEFQVRRTHFHDFMLDIHSRLRTTAGEADPLKHVADDVAAGIKVLALDELFVTDVADAMILHRLFGRLWDNGLVLVATSNRAPDALYENGLQRALFMPFIHRLKEACVVHDMASPVDYRRLAQHARGIYFLTPDRTAQLHRAFLEAGDNTLSNSSSSSGGSAAPALPGRVGTPGSADLQVAMGRSLHVPQALGKAAMFDFAELCARPLAAADYIALASAFNVLALADVPLFCAANRAAAYRFVTLVDVLYEHRVRLLVSAEGTPFELFERVLTQAEAHKAGGTTSGHISGGGSKAAGGSGGGHGMQLQHNNFSSSSGSGDAAGLELVVDDQLGFSKDRTISRLTEMQSIEYLVQHAKLHAPHLQLALQERQQQQQHARGGG